MHCTQLIVGRYHMHTIPYTAPLELEPSRWLSMRMRAARAALPPCTVVQYPALTDGPIRRRTGAVQLDLVRLWGRA